MHKDRRVIKVFKVMLVLKAFKEKSVLRVRKDFKAFKDL